jgi:TP901 family phage tail tape measure protein
MALNIDVNVQKAINDIRQLTTNMDGAAKAIDKLEAETKSLSNAHKLAEQRVVSLTAKFAAEKQSADALRVSFSMLNAESVKQSGQLISLQKQVDSLGTAHSKTSKSAKEAVTVTRSLTEAKHNLHSAARGLAGGLNTLWLAYGALVPMASAFLATATAKKIFEVGASFEYLTRYSYELSDFSMSVDDIRKSILGMKGVTKTPTELAKGFLELMKAGVGAEESMQSLDTMAKYATISEQELGAATEQLITLTSAFGKTSVGASGNMLTLADTADIVAAAAQKSVVGFTDMQTAFRYTMALASNAKLSIQEVAAALMVMGDNGLKGSIGATAMRTAITRMLDPTSAFRRILRENNMELEKFISGDRTKSLKGMIETLRDLKNAMSPEEWAKASFKGFGFRAELINVLLDNTKEFNEYLIEVARSAGFVQGVFAQLAEETAMQMKMLKSEFENALIRAFDGEKAREVLTDIRDIVASPEFSTGLANITIGTIGVGKALGSIIEAFYKLPSEIQAIGIISAILFGWKGKLLAAGLVMLADSINNIAWSIENLSLSDWITKDSKELAKFRSDFDAFGATYTRNLDLIAQKKKQLQNIIDGEWFTGKKDPARQGLQNEINALEAQNSQILEQKNRTEALASARSKASQDFVTLTNEDRRALGLLSNEYETFGSENDPRDIMENIGATASQMAEIRRLAFGAGLEEENKGLSDILFKYREKKKELTEIGERMVKYGKLTKEGLAQFTQGLSEEMMSDFAKEAEKIEKAKNKLSEAELKKLDNYIDTYFAANDRMFKQDMAMADKRKKLDAEVAGFIANEDSKTTRAKIAGLNRWYAEGQRVYAGHEDRLKDLTRMYQAQYREFTLLAMKEANDISAINKRLFDELRIRYQDHYRAIELLEFGWTELVKTGQSELGDFFVEQFGGIEGAWGSLWDAMLRKFASIIAEMAAIWAAQKFLQFITGDSTITIGGVGGGGITAGSVAGAAGNSLAGSALASGASALWAKISGAAAASTATAGATAVGTGSAGIMTPALMEAYASTMTTSMVAAAPAIGQSMGAAISTDLAASMTASTPAVTGGSSATIGAGVIGAGAVGASIAAFAISALIGHLSKNVTFAEKLTARGARPGDFAGGSGTWEDSQYGLPSKPVWDGANESVVAHINALNTYKHTLDELNPSLDMASKAAVNANGSFVVTATEIAKMGDGAEGTTLKFQAFSFDPITGAWESQTGLFTKMVEQMRELSPVTDQAIASTAAYIAEMYGLPDVADELVTAFNSAEGKLVNFGSTVVDTGGDIASTTQVFRGNLAHLNSKISETAGAVSSLTGPVAGLGSAMRQSASDVVRAINAINSRSGPSDSRARGGYIPETGTYTLHKGETVISAANTLLGSYSSGTDYVPQTGPYLLHRGEAVTSAKSNEEMIELLKELKYIALATAKHTKKSSDSMDRIEHIGLPSYSGVAS